MNKIVTIGREFAGPPEIANGGYTCGLLAREIAGPAEVTLRRPVPLETALNLVVTEEGAALYRGETLLVEARPAKAPQMHIPEPPARSELIDGYSNGFFEAHPFPNCFVCGPQRAGGKGLQVYPSPVKGQALLAAAWVPDPAWAGDDGKIRSEFLWAALDCPGGISATADDPRPILLGRLTAAVDDDLPAGEPCVVAGWVTGHQGRKYTTGTAIFDGGGRVRACGKAVWIEPR